MKELQSFPGLKASQLKNIVGLEKWIKRKFFSKRAGSGLRKGDLLRVLGTDRK